MALSVNNVTLRCINGNVFNLGVLPHCCLTQRWGCYPTYGISTVYFLSKIQKIPNYEIHLASIVLDNGLLTCVSCAGRTV